MSAPAQKDVKAALETKALTTLATLGFTVGHENSSFDSTGLTKRSYLHFIPAQPSILELGAHGSSKHTGIYQIDLDYQRNSGDTAAQSDSDAIAAAFPVNTTLSSNGQGVSIYSCGRGPGRFVDNVWWRVSVTIEWEAVIRR